MVSDGAAASSGTTPQITTLTQTLITDYPDRFVMSERSKAALWRRCSDGAAGSSGTTPQNTTLTQILITDYPDRFVISERSKAALWRRCALSRSKAISQRVSDLPEMVEPTVQYPTMHMVIPVSRSGYCGWDSEGNYHYPPDRYRPKLLGAYSFLMDMEKVGGNKKCTVFLENIETESDMGKFCNLSFRIPDRYLNEYFPWGEYYGRNGYDGVYHDCRLEMTFTVYAIDRSSGKQAKIYHSGRDANLRWYWEFPNQCCGNATTNSAPYLYAYIKNPWKQGEFGGLADKSLNVFITFRNHNGSIPIIGEDMLLYLEKGHIYV